MWKTFDVISMNEDGIELCQVKTAKRKDTRGALTQIAKWMIENRDKLPDNLSFLADPNTFKQWLYHEVPKEWVVFSKPPFAGPEEVVKYIGRYTHRSAISNNRIIAQPLPKNEHNANTFPVLR